MKGYDLTILLLCYNSKNTLERAVESIYKQITQHKFKVIAGEDCSTDGTSELLLNLAEIYPSFIPVISTKKTKSHKGGDYINFKNLYALVDTEYFCVLDADDYYIHENKIEVQINFLKENPDFVACGTNYLLKYESKDVYAVEPCDIKLYSGISTSMRDVLDGGKIPFMQTSSVMFRQLNKNDRYKLLQKFGKPFYKGDFVRNIYFSQFGKFKFLPIVGSAYTISSKGDWQKMSYIEKENYYLSFYTYHMLFTVAWKNKIFFIKHISKTLLNILIYYAGKIISKN